MKKILLILLSFIIAFSNPVNTMAGSIEDILVEKTDNVPYVFPITPESYEWKNFKTKQEILTVCQIPEEKLKNMTTEALLETVLDYPLITDYLAFNSFEDACNVMCNDFNGFEELLSREDVTTVVLNRYATSNVLTINEVNTDDVTLFFEPATIEYLIVCDEIKNGKFVTKEAEILENLHTAKVIERNNAGIYSYNSEIYSTYQDEDTEVEAGEIWTAVPNGTVKTPNGTNVREVYQRSPELTDVEKESLNRVIDSRYPYAVRVGEATVNYNCHSYAWYSNTTSNPYWIGLFLRPDEYITDGSYSLYTNGSPRDGMKAWYNGGEHSGICIGARLIDGAQVFYIESKWGMYGVYQHTISHCPYTNSVQFYVRNYE